MQTEEPAKKSARKPLVVAVALVVALFIGFLTCGGPTENEKIVIGTNAEYNEVLKKAEDASKDVLPKLTKNETLTDQDKEKLAQAAAYFQALVDYEPRHFAPQLALGMIYRGLGNLEGAELNLRTCLKNIPDSQDQAFTSTKAEAHYQLSLVAYEVHLYSAARDEATEALKINPENPNYLVARASAQMESGRQAEAKKDLQEALRLDPAHQRAKGMLKLMEMSESSKPPKASS